MEQDLMERLLTDFNGVLNDINELIKNNDFDGVQETLKEISRIVAERDNIPLNDIEGNEYDNVLHELLDKLEGVVEREVIVKGIDGVQGSKYYTNDEIDTEIRKVKDEITNLWNEFRDVIVNEGANGDRQNEILKRIEDANLKVKELEDSKVPGQENSTYKYIDENLKSLQDEREKLIEEKAKNNDEISMLVTPTDSLDKIREKKMSELIDSLNIHSEEISDLEEEITNLKHRQTEAEQALKNERGDSTFAKNVRADIEKIKQYLQEKQSKLDELTNNLENNPEIDFLKTFISDEDLTIGQTITDLENARIPLEEEIANLKHRQTEAEQALKNERGDSTFAKNVRADIEKIKQYLQEKQSKLDEINNKISKLKEISGISEIENGIQQDNSERIAALEEKNNEIDRKIAEIDDKIQNIPGATPKKTTTEKIDVKEEAQKIGDNLFKTAQIRRELYDRDISRDDFLRFYTAGMNEAKKQLNELVKFKREIEQEVGMVNVDVNSDKTLVEQIEEAEQAENPNQKLIIELYEKLRQNFISVGRREQLEEVGINHAISSEADVELMRGIFSVYKQKVNAAIDDINTQYQDLKENIEIFSREIDIINQEKVTLEVIGKSKEEYRKTVENSIATRKALLEISMTPEKELTEEQRELLNKWQETSEKFLLERRTTSEFTYVDKNGETKTINVESIDDSYPEYKEDIEFLGVPDYKENLEKLNAYMQTEDPYVFGEEVGKTYEALEAKKKGLGQAYIAKQVGDRQKYIETFNGIPNSYKLKYENLKTAGSTLKSMKPIGRDLPLATRAKNSLENVGRFFGIRAPKFKKIDDHGNEVRDIKGGIATLAIDAAVIGAVVASAVTIGPGLAVAGYAAKGIVVAGNKVASRVVYARHKDEIDNNLPTLNQTDAASREEARKTYYRDKEGKNRLVAWAKAKADRYITRKRGRETEKIIVQEAQEEFEKASLERLEKVEEDIDKLQANQEARIDRTKQQAMSARTYNDIIRDPDSVDMDEAAKTIANNAVINSKKPGRGNEDLNKGSKVARKEQYIREDGNFAETQELSGAASERVDGKVSAITESERNQAIKRKIDNANKVATVILTAGIKSAITAFKGGFTEEVTETIHHDAEYGTETVYQDPVYQNVEVTDYDIVPDTDITLQELINQKSGETFNRYYSVSGGLKDQKEIILDSDQKITSLWVGDESLVGSGVSDTSGLTAPVLTDQTVAQSLLDSNGVLRQDITVQDLLDAANGDISNLENVYVNIDDQYWVSLSDLMEGMTKEVVSGSHIESQLIEEGGYVTREVLLQEAYDEFKTTNVFSPEKVVKTVAEGAGAGAVIAGADTVHEAVKTTYNNGHIPGSPKETMPLAYTTVPREQEIPATEEEKKETPQVETNKKDPFTRISEKKQAEVNKAREKRDQEKEAEKTDEEGR